MWFNTHTTLTIFLWSKKSDEEVYIKEITLTQQVHTVVVVIVVLLLKSALFFVIFPVGNISWWNC